MKNKIRNTYSLLILGLLLSTLASCVNSGTPTTPTTGDTGTGATTGGSTGIETGSGSGTGTSTGSGTGTGTTTGTTTPTNPGSSASFDINTQLPFPSDSPWNQDISKAEIDPNSQTYINSLNPVGTLHPDFGTVWDGAPNGQPYIVVPGNQKKVPVTFNYASESDPGPYPIPANAPIQGGPNGTGDRHVIVIDKDNGILYELFNAFPDGSGGWKADSGAIFNLHTNAQRPAGWTSADAAGLPIYPGLVRYKEVAVDKEIRHALRFTANQTNSAYVYPASHVAGINNPNLPPMGMRVRLKANYDISKFPANVRIILTAMKKYGMILADNGVSWMFSGEPNANWNDTELHELTKVPGSAFEVIKMGALHN